VERCGELFEVASVAEDEARTGHRWAVVLGALVLALLIVTWLAVR